MTTTAQTFVSCIPSTEEEMHAICGEIVRRNNDAQNFANQIEAFEQLVAVMKEWQLHYGHPNRKKT